MIDLSASSIIRDEWEMLQSCRYECWVLYVHPASALIVDILNPSSEAFKMARPRQVHGWLDMPITVHHDPFEKY